MLDSLVRVSRRVGWAANRFATDPRRGTERPGPPRQALRTHCRTVCPVRDSLRGPGSPSPPEGGPHGVSSVPQPANTAPVYNTPPSKPGRATFPRGLRRPENRSWRSPRGKCTGPWGSPATDIRAMTPLKQCQLPAHGHRLNSTGRLCGPIRLPLCGFTYS